MPLRRIEPSEQHVDVARARIEIDLGRQPVDQLGDAIGMALDEVARKTAQVSDISFGRHDCKKIGGELAGRRAEEPQVFALLENVEAAVEVALEPVDGAGIEPLEARMVEHLIKPVLALDQKIQAALAVVDVERQKELGPMRDRVGDRRLGAERMAFGFGIDEARVSRPRIDDLRNGP